MSNPNIFESKFGGPGGSEHLHARATEILAAATKTQQALIVGNGVEAAKTLYMNPTEPAAPTAYADYESTQLANTATASAAQSVHAERPVSPYDTEGLLDNAA